MDLEKTLRLSEIYGIASVMLFCMASFLAWLIYYVLKQNEKRELRYIDLHEVHISNMVQELKQREIAANEFRYLMKEAQKYQREENIQMINSLNEISRNISSLSCLK